MRIVVLSRNPTSYSCQRLVEAGKKADHNVSIIDPLECYMSIATGKPQIMHEGKELVDIDAVIPRVGASITFYGTAVVRQFEMQNVFCANSSLSITRSRDKLRSLQILAKQGIPMPVTGFAGSTKETRDIINMVGGAPLIIKLLEGSQGSGVVLAETKQAAESVIEAFRELHAQILVQEFIKESNGQDFRCFVVDGRVIATMQRSAAEGEFRANIHRGGSGSRVKLDPEDKAIALAAAKAMGLRIAGVDLIRSNRGTLVLEVNSSPGLEGIETATKPNIAEKIISFVEKRAAKGANADRVGH